MKEKIIYIADDGTEFHSKEKCISYENLVNRVSDIMVGFRKNKNEKGQNIAVRQDSEIVKNIVDTKEKFIDYVSLIAAAGSDDMAGVLERISRRKENSKKIQGIVTPALYENMLRMVSEDPKRLEQIEKFVKEMEGSDVVDESFKRMLKTFKNVVDKDN